MEGRESEHYRTALELLDRAEEENATAEAEPRQAEARARAVREALGRIEFVRIPPGDFLMGSEREEVTQVRISQGFWLGEYEVTQAVGIRGAGRDERGSVLRRPRRDRVVRRQ